MVFNLNKRKRLLMNRVPGGLIGDTNMAAVTSHEKTIIKVHTRGHVAATYPWEIYPQHFHVHAHVVILSLLHVHAKCRLSVHYSFSVAATCPCNMTPRVCPLLLLHRYFSFPLFSTSSSLAINQRFIFVTARSLLLRC